jgi:hypothetical protein
VLEPTPADRIKVRTDADAKKRYLSFLQASLSAMHQWAVWRVAPVRQSDALSAFTQPEWLPFGSGDVAVALRATQRIRYLDDQRYPGERKVQTADYGYTLRDADQQEIVSWQWHPSVGDYEMPHVHAGRGLPGDFGRLHIPTGRVAFEDVLLFLIKDFAVQPAKVDGEELIRESLRRFRSFSTWG